jgi:hypothetical protein
MRTPGSVAPGDVAARATRIDVACSRCERRGRYPLARLVNTHGPDFAMTDLGAELANCTRRMHRHHERCDVFFRCLAVLMSNSETKS